MSLNCGWAREEKSLKYSRERSKTEKKNEDNKKFSGLARQYLLDNDTRFTAAERCDRLPSPTNIGTFPSWKPWAVKCVNIHILCCRVSTLSFRIDDFFPRSSSSSMPTTFSSLTIFYESSKSTLTLQLMKKTHHIHYASADLSCFGCFLFFIIHCLAGYKTSITWTRCCVRVVWDDAVQKWANKSSSG